MTYKTFDGTEHDTVTMPLKKLIQAVMALKYRRSVAWSLRDQNGADFDVRLVRALRARLFRDHESPVGKLRAVLNAIDPPRCRCGKLGTRIFGGTTFCEQCGMTELQKAHLVYVERQRTLRGVDIEARRSRQWEYISADGRGKGKMKKGARR